MRKFIIITLLSLASASCMTVGNKFDPDLVNQLEPQVSTIQDATKLLGPPMAQSAMPNGQMLYQWQYSQGHMFGGSGAHVSILFTKTGKMVGVQHKSTTQVY